MLQLFFAQFRYYTKEVFLIIFMMSIMVTVVLFLHILPPTLLRNIQTTTTSRHDKFLGFLYTKNNESKTNSFSLPAVKEDIASYKNVKTAKQVVLTNTDSYGFTGTYFSLNNIPYGYKVFTFLPDEDFAQYTTRKPSTADTMPIIIQPDILYNPLMLDRFLNEGSLYFSRILSENNKNNFIYQPSISVAEQSMDKRTLQENLRFEVVGFTHSLYEIILPLSALDTFSAKLPDYTISDLYYIYGKSIAEFYALENDKISTKVLNYPAANILNIQSNDPFESTYTSYYGILYTIRNVLFAVFIILTMIIILKIARSRNKYIQFLHITGLATRSIVLSLMTIIFSIILTAFGVGIGTAYVGLYLLFVSKNSALFYPNAGYITNYTYKPDFISSISITDFPYLEVLGIFMVLSIFITLVVYQIIYKTNSNTYAHQD
jgi:hypothetical protein